MGFVSLFLLAVSLAMDCFAVSCSAGALQPDLKPKNVLFFGFCFGFFQALMPLIGWLSGELVVQYLSRFTNWIAFGILMMGLLMMIISLIFLINFLIMIHNRKYQEKINYGKANNFDNDIFGNGTLEQIDTIKIKTEERNSEKKE